MNLPEDLVVEILSRIPALSVARLRSTSKRWNALVRDGRLAKKHSAYAPRHSPPLVMMLINFRVYLLSFRYGTELSAKVTGRYSLKDPLSKSSEEVDIRSVCHCDGLLLCTTKDNRLVVWNPCSGETRWIQPRNSYKESTEYALGYDNRSSCYKILRMDRLGNVVPFETEYEVYDFTSKSWRVVGKTRDWFISRIWGRMRGLSVKGSTYWFAVRQDRPSNDRFLLCFDFSTDRFQSLSLPVNVSRPYCDVSLSVTREEQQLCMFATKDNSEAWIATKVLESTGAMAWSKFRRCFHHLGNQMMTLLADHEQKNVSVCCYKPTSSKDILHTAGKAIYIIFDDGDSTYPLLLTYVPTLVQIQQGI